MQMILAKAKTSIGPETQVVFLGRQGLMLKQSLPLTHKEALSQECRSHAQESGLHWKGAPRSGCQAIPMFVTSSLSQRSWLKSLINSAKQKD